MSNDTVNDEPLAIYPNSNLAPFNTWTRDNLGPIHIPAKGETIQLTPENIALYKRVISVYENNDWVELRWRHIHQWCGCYKLPLNKIIIG
ncbi:MAG: hypothetical protein IPP69_14850 [Flavobacteriales bacterium]|nr:hypothetical protein [Flavobacteriales bacterium]